MVFEAGNGADVEGGVTPKVVGQLMTGMLTDRVTGVVVVLVLGVVVIGGAVVVREVEE